MSSCPICLPPSLKSTQLCLHWGNEPTQKRKLICDELGNKLECSFLLLLQLIIIQPLCSNLGRKCWQTVMFACRGLKAVSRRRYCRRHQAPHELRSYELEERSWVMQGELVLWRGESKGNEWKWKCRWEECLPATAAAARLPPPKHQCSALLLVFSILFPTWNKRQLLNSLLAYETMAFNHLKVYVIEISTESFPKSIGQKCIKSKMGYLTITSTIKEDWIDDFSFYTYFVKLKWKSRKLIVCRVPPASLSLDLTDTRACCCCCSNQLGIIIPWGLHEVLGGLRQHLLVVHTSFPPTTTFSRRCRRFPLHGGWWNAPHTLPQFGPFKSKWDKRNVHRYVSGIGPYLFGNNIIFHNNLLSFSLCVFSS